MIQNIKLSIKIVITLLDLDVCLVVVADVVESDFSSFSSISILFLTAGLNLTICNY